MKRVILTIILGMLSIYAMAGEEPIGMVTALKNKGFVVHKDGSKNEIGLKSLIYEGDVVSTGPDGVVKVVFKDGTFIRLLGASEVCVDSYRYSAEQSQGRAVLRAKDGTFSFSAGNLSKIKYGQIEVCTQTATIGIRGSYAQFQTSGDYLKVNGIGIYLIDSQGKEQSVDPGNYYYVTADKIYVKRGEENFFSHSKLAPASMVAKTSQLREALSSVLQPDAGRHLSQRSKYRVNVPVEDPFSQKHDGKAAAGRLVYQY